MYNGLLKTSHARYCNMGTSSRCRCCTKSMDIASARTFQNKHQTQQHALPTVSPFIASEVLQLNCVLKDQIHRKEITLCISNGYLMELLRIWRTPIEAINTRSQIPLKKTQKYLNFRQFTCSSY